MSIRWSLTVLIQTVFALAAIFLSRWHEQVEAGTTAALWVGATNWWIWGIGFFVCLGGALLGGLEFIVVRPLRMLELVVRRLGEGTLVTRAPDLRGAELSKLAQGINAMASALQQERETLEQQISARTQELQEANVRLERLAVTDGLTGLYNHRRFQEALRHELLRSDRHRRPLGLLMIDVDFFKRVNDALGHPAGDELLRTLATILTGELRQIDLLARYGGEEFAVLLPETTRTEAAQVAERMRRAVEAGVNAESSRWPMRVTVSIGVATYPDDAKTAEEMIVASDQAMYLAKRQGRNRVVDARGIQRS